MVLQKVLALTDLSTALPQPLSYAKSNADLAKQPLYMFSDQSEQPSAPYFSHSVSPFSLGVILQKNNPSAQLKTIRRERTPKANDSSAIDNAFLHMALGGTFVQYVYPYWPVDDQSVVFETSSSFRPVCSAPLAENNIK